MTEPDTTGPPDMPRRSGRLFAGSAEQPDNYELLDEGFEGGEGITWRALDHGLRAPAVCAVKALPSTAGRDRLDEWKRLSQLLRPPHVVSVHDVLGGPPPHPRGQADHGADPYLFVIMEWVDGPTLRQHVDGAPATGATILERLRLVSQLAEALTALSGEGLNAVLHRDVKPGNCIVHPQRGLVLIDVTSARPMSDGFDAFGSHTREYAAPEVLASPRRARTTASEIYSLGAVAAFCLLGRDPVAATLATDLMAAAAACRVPDPEAFVRHLLAAMAADPSRRPRHLRQWSDELVRLAIHSPPPPAPPPAPPSAARPSGRRYLVAAVCTVAAIGFGVAVAHFVWGANAASAPRPTASAPGQPPSNAVTVAPSIRGGSAPRSAPTTTRAATPTGSAPTASRISTTPTSRPATTAPPTVVARGSITSPRPGADVQTCSYFSGTAVVPAGSTLILTKRNLSTGNTTVYSELVHGWDRPGALSRWEGAQYFGAGDESSGQSYEVGLRAVPMSAARDFRDGKTDEYGVELAKRGRVLDTVKVDRVEGESPDHPCEGR